MGDRASIVFHDRDSVSPTVYLHWHGGAVPAWLADLARLMAGRHNDASYAAARFVGLCHAQIAGNLSLGITSNDLCTQDLADHELLCEMSPGNAGFVVVDTADFTWRAFGGYLAHHNQSPIKEEGE